MSKIIFQTLDSETNDAQLTTLKKILELMNGDLASDGSGGGIVVVGPGGSQIDQPVLTKPADGKRQFSRISATKAFMVTGYNTGPDQWIMLIDKNADPVNGDAAVWNEFVQAESTFSFLWGNRGIALASGMVVANSSTPGALTLGAVDTYFNLAYL